MYHNVKTKRRKNRKYEVGREAAETVIKDVKRKTIKVRGGGEKSKLLSVKFANVIFKNQQKPANCEIVTVENNPASKHFTRRSIITRGAILKVKTAQDKQIQVKVTSRPGQDGVINALEV